MAKHLATIEPEARFDRLIMELNRPDGRGRHKPEARVVVALLPAPNPAGYVGLYYEGSAA